MLKPSHAAKRFEKVVRELFNEHGADCACKPTGWDKQASSLLEAMNIDPKLFFEYLQGQGYLINSKEVGCPHYVFAEQWTTTDSCMSLATLTESFREFVERHAD